MAEPVNRIPPAILKMLGDNEWRPTEGHSLFDQVWGDEANGHHRERQRDPSFYYFLKRDLAENNNGVSGREVEALSGLAMFKGLIDAQPEHFAFNEHAQHALTAGFILECMAGFVGIRSFGPLGFKNRG